MLGSLLSAPWHASAGSGDGLGVGPVFAFSGEYTFVFGWEASATTLLPTFKLSIGGSYDLWPRGHDPYTVHYVAWEPWLLLGGTLGAAIADGRERVRFMYGLWEGFPITLHKGANSGSGSHPGWLLTLSIGIRAFGSTNQLYFTPKIWSYTPIDFGD